MVKKLAALSCLTVVVAAGIELPLAAPAFAAPDKGAKDEAAKDAAETPLDELIMANGKVIKGRILEETERHVRIKAVIAGIEAEATYPKGDILKVTYGKDLAKDDAAKSDTVKDVKHEPKKDSEDEPAFEDADTTKFYVVEFGNYFGREVSETPIRELFEDVDAVFGDKIERLSGEGIVEQVDPRVRDKHILVIKMNTQTPQIDFDAIWRTEELGPLFEHEMDDEHRRVIFWIESAVGGAVFLPWVSSEIYFTSDGVMGGVGTLQWFSFGDEWVREKQISLRMGHAEGFVIKGGYAEHVPLIRAMCRAEFWLYVKLEGGEPIYLNEPYDEVRDGARAPWNLLDDNRGTVDLDSDWAFKLGVSKGTVDTIDELADKLGVQHNYKVMKDTQGGEIFGDWAKRLASAEEKVHRRQDSIGTLWVEFYEIQVEGDYQDRKKARSHQQAVLKEIRSLFTQFAEVLDPSGEIRAEIDLTIDVIKDQQVIDTNAQRGSRGGGNGGGGGGSY